MTTLWRPALARRQIRSRNLDTHRQRRASRNPVGPSFSHDPTGLHRPVDHVSPRGYELASWVAFRCLLFEADLQASIAVREDAS